MQRVNEITNPLFRGAAPYAQIKNATARGIDHENGKRYIDARYTGGDDPYCDLINRDVPPGEYTLYCEMYAQYGNGAIRVFTRSAGAATWNKIADRTVTKDQTIAFTIAGLHLLRQCIVRISFETVPNTRVMLTRPNLELSSTFDPDNPYFDYSAMPLEKLGGGAYVIALALLLASLIGGWRHEDCELESGSASAVSRSSGACRVHPWRERGVDDGFQFFEPALRASDRQAGPGGRRSGLGFDNGDRVRVRVLDRTVEHGEPDGDLVVREHARVPSDERLSGDLDATRFDHTHHQERDILPVPLGHPQGHVRCGRPADAVDVLRDDAVGALAACGLAVVA